MKAQDPLPTFGNPSPTEKDAYERLVRLLRSWAIPDNEILKDLPLFLTRATLGHTLFLDALYRRILNVSGCVFEFGVRWGRTQSLFASLRTLYEPYNMSRKLIGFDTFEGFPSVSKEDGAHSGVHQGALNVTENYQEFLEQVLKAQQDLGPRSHVPRFELVQGDATATLPAYLESHPETICALAYFDFDLFEPTQKCLIALRDVMTRGTVVAFDEIGHRAFPGETVAVKQVLGLSNITLQRDPRVPFASFLVVE